MRVWAGPSGAPKNRQYGKNCCMFPVMTMASFIKTFMNALGIVCRNQTFPENFLPMTAPCVGSCQPRPSGRPAHRTDRRPGWPDRGSTRTSCRHRRRCAPSSSARHRKRRRGAPAGAAIEHRVRAGVDAGRPSHVLDLGARFHATVAAVKGGHAVDVAVIAAAHPARTRMSPRASM